MFLMILAIVVGVAIAVTRLPGVFLPEFARKVLRFMLERRGFALAMMVVAAGIGGLFIWAFRIYHAESTPVGWVAWVLLAFGCILTFLALVGLAAPKIPFGLAAKLFVSQDATVRWACIAGFLVGIVVALLGLRV